MVETTACLALAVRRCSSVPGRIRGGELMETPNYLSVATTPIFSGRSLRQGGQAKVAFRIDRAGKLMSSNIVSGAGFPALDKAALEIVRSAQPFPPAPPEVSDDDLKLVAPMIFTKADRPISREAVRRAEKLRSTTYSICRGC